MFCTVSITTSPCSVWKSVPKNATLCKSLAKQLPCVNLYNSLCKNKAALFIWSSKVSDTKISVANLTYAIHTLVVHDANFSMLK